MTSKLDQLKAMTTVVADTGDMASIRAFQPTDCTTNPTLILKAAQMPAYAHLVDEAVVWAKSHGASASERRGRSARRQFRRGTDEDRARPRLDRSRRRSVLRRERDREPRRAPSSPIMSARGVGASAS
jgi:hypothetical protein